MNLNDARFRSMEFTGDFEPLHIYLFFFLGLQLFGFVFCSEVSSNEVSTLSKLLDVIALLNCSIEV